MTRSDPTFRFTLPAAPTGSVTVCTADAIHARDLRRRADHLSELARAIETSVVGSVAACLDEAPPGRRRDLCEQLLERQLHQLHQAADDLRTTAHRFRARADELDIATTVEAA